MIAELEELAKSEVVKVEAKTGCPNYDYYIVGESQREFEVKLPCQPPNDADLGHYVHIDSRPLLPDCSCGVPRINRQLCIHIVAACQKRPCQPESMIHPLRSLKALKATYRSFEGAGAELSIDSIKDSARAHTGRHLVTFFNGSSKFGTKSKKRRIPIIERVATKAAARKRSRRAESQCSTGGVNEEQRREAQEEERREAQEEQGIEAQEEQGIEAQEEQQRRESQERRRSTRSEKEQQRRESQERRRSTRSEKEQQRRESQERRRSTRTKKAPNRYL